MQHPPISKEEYEDCCHENQAQTERMADILQAAIEEAKAAGYTVLAGSFVLAVTKGEDSEPHCLLAGTGGAEELGNIAIDLMRAAEYMAVEEESAEGQTLQ